MSNVAKVHGAFRRDRFEFWLFMLFAAYVLAVGIGMRAPWPADEPRFVLVARQMWESGDWLFPHRGRELYADKPPVYFWLLNFSYAVVHDWNRAFLLPSLFSALATLLLTADLGRRLWTPRVGLWAAAATLCAVQFVYQAKRAQIDPTVVLLITLGCYGLIRHLLLGPDWRWYWIGCFAAGLGIATKGVGFLPLLLLLPYALARRGDWMGLSDNQPHGVAKWLLGIVAVLAGVGIWLVPMLITALSSASPEHRAYLDELLFRQTATRYVNAWHHTQPFWYFGEVIALFWLPFSLALPWLIAPWREAWRLRDARIWLPLCWVLLVLLFFTASPGKRDMYILPALPMLALAAAPYLPRLAHRKGLRIAMLAFLVVLGGTFSMAGVAALWTDQSFEKTLIAARGLSGSAHVDRLWIALTAMGVLLLGAAIWSRLRRPFCATAFGIAVLWTGYAVGIAPVLDDESSGRSLMTQARARVGNRITIGMVGWTEQMLLQAAGPTAEFGFKVPLEHQLAEALSWVRVDPDSRRILVEESNLPKCATGGESAGAARGDWRIIDAAGLRTCTPQSMETSAISGRDEPQ